MTEQQDITESNRLIADWDSPALFASQDPDSPDEPSKATHLDQLLHVALHSTSAGTRIKACRELLKRCPVAEPEEQIDHLERAYAKIGEVLAAHGITLAGPPTSVGVVLEEPPPAAVANRPSARGVSLPVDRKVRTIAEENQLRLANRQPLVNAWRWDAERGCEIPDGPEPPDPDRPPPPQQIRTTPWPKWMRQR